MSFGKLYGFKVCSFEPGTAEIYPANLFIPQENARTTALLAVAKENKLDIEFVETKTPVTDTEYLKLNPLAQVPTFVGPNGFILTESIAIAIYCECHCCPAPHISLLR
jgi:glutathione S-transferase